MIVLLGLLTLIREGRDTATHAPGSKEREIIKRFSVLCPNSPSKKRNSVALRPDASSSQNGSVETRLPAGTLPSPSLTNFESPGDLQWFPAFWEGLQDFTVEPSGSEMAQIPSGTYDDQLGRPSDMVALGQLRLPEFSPPADDFGGNQFVTL